jgi:DNA mismatch repair protein MutS
MTTPMMVQWQACKAKAKGALLLFRLGDFYEAFEDDAIVLSKELDLVLTKRQETPMAGIPAHSADTYLDRLVGRGYRVAIAEQMEDPKDVKGIVKREVVRLLTPGSVIQSVLLQDKAANFMVAVVVVNTLFGLAALDVTTGDFRVMEFTEGSHLVDELSRLGPQELLISEKAWSKLQEPLQTLGIPSTQVRDEWHFDRQSSFEKLTRQFNVHSLDGFGCKGMTASINAAGGLLSYALEDLNLKLPHLKKIAPVQAERYLWLDRTTQKHLELIHPLHEKGLTLLSVLDTTVTPMGGRLFKEWLLHPLVSVEDIHKRQDAVEKYVQDDKKRCALRDALENVRDLERLTMRIETGYTSPRDLVGLRHSLEPLPEIAKYISPRGCIKCCETHTGGHC